jgi:hypothetical protein
MSSLRGAAAAFAVFGGVFGAIATGGFAVVGCGDSSPGSTEDAQPDQTSEGGSAPDVVTPVRDTGKDVGLDTTTGDARDGGGGDVINGGGDGDATVTDANDSGRDGDATVDALDAGNASSDGDAGDSGNASQDADTGTASDAADASDALDAADGLDGWDGAPNALQKYSMDYATAYCMGQGKCCAGFDAGAFSVAACAAANSIKGWRSTLPASALAYTRGNLTLNAEAGAGCISALQAFPCGNITTAQFAAILNACNGVLTGTIANGSGPCVSAFECANGYCSLPSDGGPGTCTALVGEGGACASGNDSVDQMCSRAGVNVPRLWCDLLNHPDGGGATCIPPLANGTMCFNGSYWDDYGCASLLCGDLGCGTDTIAYPDPGWCSAYPPVDGGGG